MNRERTITELMEFIAEIPCAVSIRPSAVMMNVEKAKYRPATRPHPIAPNHSSIVVKF
jgi:hypothetical protein